MSASLVGSEMCIRDSTAPGSTSRSTHCQGTVPAAVNPRKAGLRSPPVSYTHLTLPTICSV
eukprot:4127-Alexandrium_andersonii.AAC.1